MYFAEMQQCNTAALFVCLHACRLAQVQSLCLTVAKEAMLVPAGTVSSYLELSHAEGSSQQVKYFTVMLVLPLIYP